MAFSLKTWVDRISEYPNRRKLTHEDGSTELVTVARAEGQISAEGNAFSAEEMNDLENRIKVGFDEVNQSKLSSIIGSMISASSAVTVAAGGTVDFTVTFPVPDGCETHPFFAYVKSTGWSGLITQGTIVSVTKAEATFTLYNASTSQRTVKPQCVALFMKK